MTGVSCLACGNVMFNIKVYDDGHTEIERSARDLLQSDEEDEYFIFPHCHAKNVIISAQSQSGLPGIRISHLKS